jgi:uncharacterized protein (TIGR03437 family)
VNTLYVDNHPASAGPTAIAAYYDGTLDTTTDNAALTYTAGYPNLTNATTTPAAAMGATPTVALGTYYQKQAATQLTQTLSITATNDDTTSATEPYNYTFSGACTWLTLTGLHNDGTAGHALANSTNGGDTLTFMVKTAGGADTITTANLGLQSCSILLENLNGVAGTFATVNVTLNVQAGLAPLTGALTYQLKSDPATVPSVTSTILASDGSAGMAYTAALGTCSTYFTIKSGGTGVTPGTLVLNLIDSAADALTVGGSGPTYPCTLNLSNATSSATDIVTTTVTTAAVVTTAAQVITYVYNTPANTVSVTPTSTIPNTPWTAVVTDGTPFVSVTASGIADAAPGPSTQLVITMIPAAANLLGVGSGSPKYINHVTLTAGAVVVQFTVTLTETIGATTLLSTPTAVNFQYVPGNPAVLPAPQTTIVTDSIITDIGYTVSIPGGYAWLSVSSANGSGLAAGLSQGSDALTFAVDMTKWGGTTTPQVAAVATVNVTLTAPNENSKTVVVSLYVVNPNTLSATPTSLSFATNYVKGSPSTAPAALSVTVTDTNTPSGDTYSVNAPAWLTCARKDGGSIGGTGTDQLTCSVNTAGAEATPTGPQTGTVHLQLSEAVDATFTVSLTITTTVSPLSANPTTIAMSYLVNGSATQQAVTTGYSAVISSVNTAYEPYTTTLPTLPTWLTAVAVNNRADFANTDSIVFKVVPANLPAGPGKLTANVHLAITGNPSEPDYVIPVTLTVTTSVLSSTGQSAPLTFVKSTGLGTTTNRVVITDTSNVSFTLNIATLPPWLTTTFTGSSNTTSTITFNLVTATAATMATGNYTANIGFSTTGYADLVVPITLQVSNGPATLGLVETTATQSVVWGSGTAVPAPVWTPYSSDEPISFSATCTVTPSDTGWVPNAAWAKLGNVSPCSLNVAADLAATPALPVTNTVTGVAFTTGYTITASLDPGLFASTLGNTVSVTVQVVQTAGGTGFVGKTYVYSLQPVNPKITSASPASVAVIAANTSMAILLTGSNFVGSQNITPAALNVTLVPTQVYLGTSATALSSGVVVVSPTQMQVTIPQTAFTQYATIASGQTSAKLAIGIANQTTLVAPSGPTATTSVLVTTAPVIYAVTSTATYMMPSTLGGNPSVAPFELISIFGDNFGLNVLTPPSANAVVNSYDQVPTSLTISGSAVNKNLVALSAAFVLGKTTFAAPILFANQNQINAIVPSGMLAGTAAVPSTYTLTVTSGAATNVSTPVAVNVLAADPGIITLASDGSGQGAIVNLKNGSINKTGNEATAGDYVSIYLTGLGSPDSTGLDATGNGLVAPTNCVAVNGSKTSPGYLQVVNTTVKASSTTTAYTSPAWTSIDGAVITYGPNSIISGLPPCFTDTITVTFGTGANAVLATSGPGGKVLYAGFVSGSVAGLYQINVQIPAGIQGLPGAIPIQVTLPPYTSPATVVTMALK